MQPYRFEAGGHTYAGQPLSVLSSLDVARKFTPVLALLAARARGAEAQPLENLARGLVAASGSIPADDYQFVLGTCLRSLKRVDKTSGEGAPVWSDGGGLMFQDLKLADLAAVLYKVLESNGLVDFFYATPAEDKGTDRPPA
jgi:hypothetical protein